MMEGQFVPSRGALAGGMVTFRVMSFAYLQRCVVGLRTSIREPHICILVENLRPAPCGIPLSRRK